MSLGTGCGSLDKAKSYPRWLQDHDTDQQYLAPPIQNTWYELFDAEDVRLLYCHLQQSNDETNAKTIATRWTIDGNVYYVSQSLNNNTVYAVLRSSFASGAGTSGLEYDTNIRNAALFIDKRGLSFKVEARITDAPGTNQILFVRCVRETLEVT